MRSSVVGFLLDPGWMTGVNQTCYDDDKLDDLSSNALMYTLLSYLRLCFTQYQKYKYLSTSIKKGTNSEILFSFRSSTTPAG